MCVLLLLLFASHLKNVSLGTWSIPTTRTDASLMGPSTCTAVVLVRRESMPTRAMLGYVVPVLGERGRREWRNFRIGGRGGRF